MVTDLPGKKSQDITVILCLVDLQHRLHCGLHVVWDWTENRQKDTPEFKTYMYTACSDWITCVDYLTV